MAVVLLSDIHGNLNALRAVAADISSLGNIEGCLILGDVIDYGMRSNEVIDYIKNMDLPIISGIRGNHERAILEHNYDGFSSARGVECAKYTASILSSESRSWLEKSLTRGGKAEIEYAGKKLLLIHGGFSDEYWKSIGLGSDLTGYEKYDYVLSGHSHIPHFFEKFYPIDNEKMRNKKKTIFINPGSVGQPRNHDPRAQYAVVDFLSGDIHFKKVEYDIADEQKYFGGFVDEFYKTRLKDGI